MTTLFLAHGASGTAASMAAHVRGMQQRGVATAAVALPRGRAEAAMAAYRTVAEPSLTHVIGGHSFGGRVASLLAAQERYRGLVLLSYPLHPPGDRERWDVRTEHWPRIVCPVLLISGDRDPFAAIGLLHHAVARLQDPTLIVIPRLGHGLGPHLDAALDRMAAWMSALPG